MASYGEIPSRMAKWVWEESRGFFVIMFQNVWAGLADSAQYTVNAVVNQFSFLFPGHEKREWDAMLGVFISSGMLDKDSDEEIIKLKDMSSPLDWVFFFMIYFTLAKNYTSATLYGASSDLRHNLNEKYSPEIPQYRDIMQAAFVAPEKTQEVREAMRKSGLSDEHIDLCFLSVYRLYNEDVVRSLYLTNYCLV